MKKMSVNKGEMRRRVGEGDEEKSVCEGDEFG